MNHHQRLALLATFIAAHAAIGCRSQGVGHNALPPTSLAPPVDDQPLLTDPNNIGAASSDASSSLPPSHSLPSATFAQTDSATTQAATFYLIPSHGPTSGTTTDQATELATASAAQSPAADGNRLLARDDEVPSVVVANPFQLASHQPPPSASDQATDRNDNAKASDRSEGQDKEEAAPRSENIPAGPAYPGMQLPTPGNEVPLELNEVLGTTLSGFPPLREAAAIVDAARGFEISQWGAFDTNLEGGTTNQFLGFYENYRHGIGVTQPLWSGTDVMAGYRMGDGNFEPWYGERETDEGGELKVGIDAPLLQGRAIDKRRANVRAAGFDRQSTAAAFRVLQLVVQRDAASFYWNWVAAGQVVQVQRELLELADTRVDQIRRRIDAGDLPEIEDVNNQQLVADRQTKLIEAQRKLQAAAIKLSLYFRANDSQPLVPSDDRVPQRFPTILRPRVDELLSEIPSAQQRRPELVQYQQKLQSVRIKLSQAQNQLLPKLNAKLETSQDLGGKTSSRGDKQPLVMAAGVEGEVPVQRRYARGRILELVAQSQALEATLDFTQDKIGADVRDIVSQLDTAYGRIEQATRNVELARETLRLGRIAFDEGDANVIILNLREQQIADAELDLIAAKAEYLIAFAAYQAALGFDIQQ
jgi:outer membrane protein TolC